MLLLAKGRVAYLGTTKGAADFFSNQGYTCPAQYNPSDFYINTLAVVPGKEDESHERIKKICDEHDASPQGRNLKEIDLGPKNVEDPFEKKPDNFKTGFINQFRYVGWRAFAVHFRDTQMFIARVCQTLLTSIFAGLVYLQQDNDQKSIQNINGAIFFALANSTFGNCFSVISVFPLEFPVFKRDHECGMYSSFIYFMMKTLADIPVFLFIPVVSALVML